MRDIYALHTLYTFQLFGGGGGVDVHLSNVNMCLWTL